MELELALQGEPSELGPASVRRGEQALKSRPCSALLTTDFLP